MTALTFDAAHLAPAWLSVFQAAGSEAGMPAFYRAVCIEFYATGVRLASSDQTVLLHAWVPSVDDVEADPPDLDEAPKAVVVALDWSQRAKGLLDFAWKLVAKEDAPPLEVTLSVEEADDEVPQGRLDLDVPGGELVVLDVPGKERVRLQLFQGEWPNWRGLRDAFQPQATTAIALNPTMVGRLAKLGKWSAGTPIVWTFGGVDRVATIRCGEPPVEVRGFIMPMRMLGVEEPAPGGEPTSTVPDYDAEP